MVDRRRGVGGVLLLRGYSHIGLSTLDLDRTHDFYERVLGFKAVRRDAIEVQEGGRVRHVFFDTGQGQLLAFMELRGIPGVPESYDTGINHALGLPESIYHFAFAVDREDHLAAKRAELIAKGICVTPIVDHEWAKSIYLKDPNGITLEFCCVTRQLTDDDVRLDNHLRMSVRGPSPVTDFRDT